MAKGPKKPIRKPADLPAQKPVKGGALNAY